MASKTEKSSFRFRSKYWLYFYLFIGFVLIFILLIQCYSGVISYAKSVALFNNHLEKPIKLKTDDYVTVRLTSNQNGPRLRGSIIEEQQVPLAQFLGIRYARSKRFRKPEPVPVNWSGTKDALKWPPNCMQKRLDHYDLYTKIYSYNVSEDCLFLNIWTPLSAVEQANFTDPRIRSTKPLLPVIIFIHGGAFSFMGISMEAFNGRVISALGNVVFVTINYRLGLFGFFDNGLEPDSIEYDRNIGLYDQIEAIHWVRRNIRRFGGDPEQITLQGQSAGAISIGLLMVSPASRDLFKRAILQSASPMMLKQIFLATHYSQVMKLANCTTTTEDDEDDENVNDPLTSGSRAVSNKLDNDDDGDGDDDDDDDEYYETDDPAIQMQIRTNETRCLERLSAEKVNRIQDSMLKKNTVSFSPSIPSALVPAFTEELFASQGVSVKDILIGANANESTLYIHDELPELLPLKSNANLTLEKMKKVVEKLDYGSNNLKRLVSIVLDDLKAHNVTNEIDIVRHLFIFFSDLMFKGPVYKFAKLLSQDPTNNVYLYQFNETISKYPGWIGAPHWGEMDFVFGIPLLYPESFTDNQRILSRRMIKAWTYFAWTGRMPAQYALEWPKLDEHGLHMNLMADKVSIGSNLDMLYYRYFDLVYDSS